MRPLVDGHARHRRVEAVVVERQGLGGRVDRRNPVGGTLGPHRRRRLDCGHIAVAGLVRSGAGTDVQHGGRVAERSPHDRLDARVGLADVAYPARCCRSRRRPRSRRRIVPCGAPSAVRGRSVVRSGRRRPARRSRGLRRRAASASLRPPASTASPGESAGSPRRRRCRGALANSRVDLASCCPSSPTSSQRMCGNSVGEASRLRRLCFGPLRNQRSCVGPQSVSSRGPRGYRLRDEEPAQRRGDVPGAGGEVDDRRARVRAGEPLVQHGHARRPGCGRARRARRCSRPRGTGGGARSPSRCRRCRTPCRSRCRRRR